MEREKLIEKYIQNRLSKEEKAEFDTLLANDVAFKKEVSLHNDLKQVAKHEDDTDFRNLITGFETVKPQQRRNYTKWLAVASIILLVGLSYFFNLNNTPSSNELFNNYFEPYRNVIQPIERSATQQNEKTMAFMAYEKGDYAKAVQLFTNLYATTKEPYYLFYKANALLKLEKADEALPLLQEHLKTKDTLTEKTNWYMALAYLKLEDEENAKKLLQKVIAEGTYKTKEAKKLLKEFE